MIINARIDPTTGNGEGAYASSLAAAMRHGVESEPAHARAASDVIPTLLSREARHPFTAGTSLAPVSIVDDIVMVSRHAAVHDRSLRARDKMLQNEIVFDIPTVVPEHVPPRCGARASRHEPRAWSGDSTDSRSFDRSSHLAPRLSGLCKRGTHQ